MRDRSSPSPLRQLVRRCRSLGREPHPDAVRDRVRICLMDFVAAAIEAGDAPSSRQAVALASELGGSPAIATIIGSARRASVADAAFANAVQAHGLIREDTHPESTTHIGVVVLPVALAMAEGLRASGRDFIGAAVAGYEAMGRIGRVLIDARSARVHRPTGLVGPMGAAMAASCLLDLDEDRTVAALALAANQSAGLNEWARAATSEIFFHAGFAARAGYVSALLAREGATGAETVLDGSSGLVEAIGGRDRIGALAAEDDMPEIMRVYHKPAPACHFAQTPCQLAHLLSQQHDLEPARIAEIEIRVAKAASEYPGCDNALAIGSALEAKMSIQFGVASVLRFRAIEAENFRNFSDPETLSLAKRVRVVPDDALTRAAPDRFGAEINLHLVDGRMISGRQDALRACSPGEIHARCERATARAFGPARSRDFIQLVGRLDALPDCSSLASQLSVERGIGSDVSEGGDR